MTLCKYKIIVLLKLVALDFPELETFATDILFICEICLCLFYKKRGVEPKNLKEQHETLCQTIHNLIPLLAYGTKVDKMMKERKMSSKEEKARGQDKELR